ncbi:MAG: hypothetical protein WCJ35_15430 [Planctomycetota bacterium]
MNNNDSQQNPIRLADWRQRLASQLVDSGQFILLHKADPWVMKIAKYLRARIIGTTDTAKQRLAERMPHMDLAFRIYDAKGYSLRDLLEAYLLTGESVSTISEKIGIATEVIHAYAAAFFDVADRLDQAMFILHEVIFSDKGEGSRAGFLKLVAYLDGMAALDDFVERTEIGSTSKLLNLIQEETRFLFLQKVLLALRKHDMHNHRATADLINTYARREGSGKQADPPPDRMKEHFQAMMAALPFNVRGRDSENVPSELRKFQTSPVELNYGELMQVSMGQNLENEADILAMTFPPRPTAAERTTKQEPPATPAPATTPQAPPAESPPSETQATEVLQPVNPTSKGPRDSRRKLIHRNRGR